MKHFPEVIRQVLQALPSLLWSAESVHATAGVPVRADSVCFKTRHHCRLQGLIPPLLRLLATHFPHLSLVNDWLYDDTEDATHSRHLQAGSPPLPTTETIAEAFRDVQSCPSQCGLLLKQLLARPPTDVWPLASALISHTKSILDSSVPRETQELFRALWLRLNSVLPRCLWVLTINSLRPDSGTATSLYLTQENVVLDPLQVLRCDMRVFRCAPILEIVLHVLQACLAASRSQLSRHLQEHPLVERVGSLASDAEREELRTALVATQESLTVQILLEACLAQPDDNEEGQQWALREVQSVICSHLHQTFIADPNLAKLVHFQGYPNQLLPVTVAGIPSMHICLDFVPELLSQPETERQAFAIDLVSHLSVQYALPKSLSTARLAVNTLSSLIGVLQSESRHQLFLPVLPALVRICSAFPPLVDDNLSLLLQLGRICTSQASLEGGGHTVPTLRSPDDGRRDKKPFRTERSSLPSNDALLLEIQMVFASIIQRAVLRSHIY